MIAKVQPKPVPRNLPKVEKAPPIQPDPSDLEPSPGDNSLPTPGGVFKMEDIAPGGTLKGGVGSATKTGSGGAGAGTGSGGGAGIGKGPPKPVSIAAIKKRAVPLNDPQISRVNKVFGDVVVKLIVDKTGKVTKATLIKRLDAEANAVALRTARKIRFRPALDANDKPVASVVNWTFTFDPPR